MIGTPEPPRRQTYGRGLAGLVAGSTRIARIDGTKGRLWYRGIPIDELAASASFEEVSYLVLRGELPGASALAAWRRELTSWRRVPTEALIVPSCLPDAYDVLAAFRTSFAVAASLAPDRLDTSPETMRLQPARILSWSAGLAAAAIRRRSGLSPVEPRDDLGFGDHFLWLLLGREPDLDESRAFEVSLIVKAEHGIHAAALAALTVVSAGSDLDSAVLAGIGTMAGALHGGANRPAYEMIRACPDPDAARRWARERLAARERFPGFGHRIYKAPDPRARLLAPHAIALLRKTGRESYWEVFDAIRDEVERALGPKGIFANVDALTGLVYDPIGLPVDAFTIPFCLAIQTGWMAHCLEYLPDGPLIEPGAVYVGDLPDAPQVRARPESP